MLKQQHEGQRSELQLANNIHEWRNKKKEISSDTKHEIQNDWERAFKVTEAVWNLSVSSPNLNQNKSQTGVKGRNPEQYVRINSFSLSKDKSLVLCYLFICSFSAMKF